MTPSQTEDILERLEAEKLGATMENGNMKFSTEAEWRTWAQSQGLL